MILNLWGQTEFVCCHRHNEEKMQILNGKQAVFYACPKYFSENREAGEPACNNSIYLTDAEKAVKHLSDRIFDMEMDDVVPNLNNYKFTIDNVDYAVLEHREYDSRESDQENKIKIQVLNRKAINQ